MSRRDLRTALLSSLATAALALILQGTPWPFSLVHAAAVSALAGRPDQSATAAQSQSASRQPRPVRNDVVKPGRELLVLRHHELRKGGHEEFYRLSSQDVWPFFERLGARTVGQWRIVAPGAEYAADADHVYRLVRYAGFEHWRATRSGGAQANGEPRDVGLGGDGPARERSISGYGTRRGLETGSKGAYFLEGVMASGGPYFMPGLAETYDLVRAGERPDRADERIPVRLDNAQVGDEVVEVRYQRVQKNSFDRFVEATRAAVWPWEEKLGARPLGQWRVVHPDAPSRTAPSADYDEVITMTRYASRAHRESMQPDEAVFMGGNGPDYVAWRAALDLQRGLTVTSTTELTQGFMYQSPPKFLPGLPERYRAR